MSYFETIFTSYNVIGTAIGISIGSAINALIKSIVTGLILPMFGIFVSIEDMEQLTVKIGNVEFKLGDILSNVLSLVCVVIVVVFILRTIPKNLTYNR